MSFVASHCPAFCAKRLPRWFDPQVVDPKKTLCEGFSADWGAPFGGVVGPLGVYRAADFAASRTVILGLLRAQVAES